MDKNNRTQWTHIAGIIRIDDLPLLRSDQDIERRIRQKFGNTVDHEDSLDRWDNVNVPCGSDSSVQYRVDITRRGMSVACGHVAIWGDLMDYSDLEALVAWIRVATSDLTIRSASILIEMTSRGYYHLYYVWGEPNGAGVRSGRWVLKAIHEFVAMADPIVGQQKDDIIG